MISHLQVYVCESILFSKAKEWNDFFSDVESLRNKDLSIDFLEGHVWENNPNWSSTKISLVVIMAT